MNIKTIYCNTNKKENPMSIISNKYLLGNILTKQNIYMFIQLFKQKIESKIEIIIKNDVYKLVNSVFCIKMQENTNMMFIEVQGKQYNKEIDRVHKLIVEI